MTGEPLVIRETLPATLAAVDDFCARAMAALAPCGDHRDAFAIELLLQFFLSCFL